MKGRMSFIAKLFGKSHSKGDGPTTDHDPLEPVPIPALVALLLRLEKQKGEPLTEQEVNEARDKAACIMLPLSARLHMDEKRGYRDINPERAWPEWLAFKEAQRNGV
jgi:hypothetical protein